MNIQGDQVKPCDDETQVLVKGVKDRYHLVYVIVVFTGIGVLIPWNFFITAKQYFMYKLSNTTVSSSNQVETTLQRLFENYLSIFSMIPLALANIANLVLRHHFEPMNRFCFGVVMTIIVFVLTIVLVKIPTDNFQIGFFVITMVTVAILNVCSGLIQGSSLGIVSMMPQRYMKGYMEGQAIGGTLASIANIITIAALNNTETSALFYFFIALLFLSFAGIGFFRLDKIKFSRPYISKSKNRTSISVEGGRYSSFHSTESSNADVSSLRSNLSSLKLNMKQYVDLFQQVLWYALSVTVTFMVTLSLFPAIISQIKSTLSIKSDWTEKYFIPVTCFLFFNIADFMGRSLCGLVRFPSKSYPKLLFSLTMIRWCFVPLYLLCNIPGKKYFPFLLSSDAYSICFTWLLGITNGYFVTLSMMYAPGRVSDDQQEAVGTMMNLFLCIGLSLGVALSFVLSIIFI